MLKKVSKDVKHAGGIVINSRKVNGKDEVIYNDGSEHHVIIGSTGSGKTTQLVVPSIISVADSGASMILFDPKGELYKLMSPYLDAKGYTCRLLDYTDPSSGVCFNQMQLINQYYHDGLPDLYTAEGYHLVQKYLHLMRPGYEPYDDDDFLHTITPTGKRKNPMFDIKPFNFSIDKEMSMQECMNTLMGMMCSAEQDMDAAHANRSDPDDPASNNDYLYEKQRQTMNAINQIVNSLVNVVVTGDPSLMKEFFSARIEELNALIESMGDSKETDLNKHRVSVYEDFLRQIEAEGVTWDSLFFYLHEQENWHYAKYKDMDEAAMQNATVIAGMIIDSADTGHAKGEAIWSDGPKSLLTALILLTAREGLHVEASHLGSIYMQLSTMMTPIDTTGITPLDVIVENFLDDDSIKLSEAAMRTAPDKTKSSIIVSAISPMKTFSTSTVISQSSKTDFKLDECQEKPCAYFLNIPGADAASPYAVLGTLFVEQMYTVLSTYCQYSQDLSLKIPVYYILDEFANNPRVPNFDSKISLARSKKIRFDIVIQSIAQLKKVYKDEENTILENSNLIYLLTNSSETADFISKRLGKKTIQISNTSESRSATDKSSKTSTSESTQRIGRELMTSEEIMNIQPKHGIFIKPREHPCQVTFVPDYEMAVWPEIQRSQLFEIHQPRPRTKVSYFCPTDYKRLTLAYIMFYHHAIFDEAFKTALSDHNTADNTPPAPEPSPMGAGRSWGGGY